MQLNKLILNKDVTKKEIELEINALLEELKKMTLDNEESKKELQLKLDHLTCGVLLIILAET